VDNSIADLRARFHEARARLADAPLEVAADGLWHVLVAHPWYQQNLDACARRALRKFARFRDYLEEVKHETKVFLLRALRRTRDLRYDPTVTDEIFGHWVRKMTKNDCHRSVRDILQSMRRALELREDHEVQVREAPQDVIIDVNMAIHRLPLRERGILWLFAKNCTLLQIAEMLGMPHHTVRGIIEQALGELEEILAQGGYTRSDSAKRSR
jgi:RNA polymerase sigma factor (sigma-70 family)